LKNKKAAKLLIKRAKEHPDWYTPQEVYYAEAVRKETKRRKKKKQQE